MISNTLITNLKLYYQSGSFIVQTELPFQTNDTVSSRRHQNGQLYDAVTNFIKLELQSYLTLLVAQSLLKHHSISIPICSQYTQSLDFHLLKHKLVYSTQIPAHPGAFTKVRLYTERLRKIRDLIGKYTTGAFSAQ